VPTTDRVHPTPIYEFLASLVIFYVLWRLGARWMSNAPDIGELFGVYLLLSGIARFLVEFIRLNPRSFFGMTNAQTASLVGMIVGAALLFRHGTRALQT
jgi:phosphatidylglycerol:prolipoprotein diacylglycerol transferase